MTEYTIGEILVIESIADAGEGETITSYQWIFGEIPQAETGGVLTIDTSNFATGTYVLTLKVQNSCGEWSLIHSETISLVEECIPDWQCEQPLNGYESDGCGNRRLNTNCEYDPCDGVVCDDICIDYDLYSQKCVDGICVTDQLIEENSEEHCGYIPPEPENEIDMTKIYGLLAGTAIGAILLLRNK